MLGEGPMSVRHVIKCHVSVTVQCRVDGVCEYSPDGKLGSMIVVS